MQITRVAIALGVLLMTTVTCAPILHGQRPTGQNQVPSLRDVFEAISQNPSRLPDWKDFEKVELKIPASPAQDIAGALPAIMATFRNDDDKVKHYAGIALVAITTRRDSAELLRPYVPELAEFLKSPRPAIQTGIMGILTSLRPVPPPEAFPPIFNFIRRTDVGSDVQVRALATLLRAKPEDEEVIRSVAEFWARPLDTSTRVTALNAIHTSRVNDVRIQQIVVGAVDDPHPGVQLAAIGALDRMGTRALAQAQPRLKTLADSEDTRVAEAARKALTRIGPQPH